ncbi:MAG TPA: MATE family efflux transporter [Planctomycetota bacterium]|jgi:MATE family, multidrug efflux pump|nr:MATE family efflux transporter [Planctomycetota bacterium]
MSDELASPPDLDTKALHPRVRRGDLRREILRLTWPVVLQNLFRTFMIVVDTAMVGRLGAAALASMAVIGPIGYSLIAILMALGVGTIATTARATGEGDPAKLEREAATSILAALVGGLITVGPAIFLLPRLAGLFEVPGDPSVVANARSYLVWFAAAIPGLLLENAASAVLRGSGDTRTPMVFAIGANVLNIFGNYTLIFGKFGAPAMGVPGSGLSTAICYTLQGLALTSILFLPGARKRLSFESFRRVTRESAARLARVTGPALVEPLLLQTGFLIFSRSVTLLGTIPAAAHRAAITVESLSFMPGYGFSVACSALVGQYLGARRPDRAGLVVRESVFLAACLMSLIGVLFVAIPGTLLKLFIPADPEAVRIGAVCLMIAAFEQPLMGAAMSLAGGLRGAGDTRSPMVVGALSVWLVRVPLAWFLAFPAGLGLSGLWITMIVDWGARTAAFAWIVRRGRWKTVSV